MQSRAIQIISLRIVEEGEDITFICDRDPCLTQSGTVHVPPGRSGGTLLWGPFGVTFPGSFWMLNLHNQCISLAVGRGWGSSTPPHLTSPTSTFTRWKEGHWPGMACVQLAYQRVCGSCQHFAVRSRFVTLFSPASQFCLLCVCSSYLFCNESS